MDNMEYRHNAMDWKSFLEPKRVTAGYAGLDFVSTQRKCLDRRRSCRTHITYVTTKDERFAEKLSASVEDFARGVNRERFREPFFDRDGNGLPANAVKKELSRGPMFYRLMVRPFDDVMSMKFIFSYMTRVDAALGLALVWYAAIHDKATAMNENSKHAHIFIGGTDRKKKAVRLARQFKAEGFWFLAEQLATEILGPMSDDEVVEHKERSLRLASKRAAWKREPGKQWAELRRLRRK